MRALYRKYRSLSLDRVVGQDHITVPLAASIKSGKLSHAYLLTGPRGVGKTSVARIIAHEINRFPYQLEDHYVDIIEIDAASHTGVDNIRDLLERAELAPTAGTHKVYIIDEVHMLSKSAFNALLKTLEEPPAHVIFLLATTDVDKVPVTILSRAQQLKFRLASEDTLAKHLTEIAAAEKIKITEGALALIARLGRGSFRDALSLLDQASSLPGEITESALEEAFGLADEGLINRILTEVKSQNPHNAIAILDEVCYNGTVGEISPDLIERLIALILDQKITPAYPLATRLARCLSDPSPLPLSLKTKLAFLETPAKPSSGASSPDLAASENLVFRAPTPKTSTNLPSLDRSASATGKTVERSVSMSEAQSTSASKGSVPDQRGRVEQANPVTTGVSAASAVEAANDSARVTEGSVSERTGASVKSESISEGDLISEDSWKQAVETLKKPKPGIYAIIKDKPIDINGQKITVFAGSPFFQKKIDVADVKHLLTATLPGAEIIISSKKSSKPPAPASISDIIEIGEEVTLDVEF